MVPVETHGRRGVLLRDPQRLSTCEVILPPDMAYLLTQFDGTRTIREVQVDYVRRFGTLLTSDRIEALLRQLDEALLLESERFAQFKAQAVAAFRARATRQMAHAGQCYPEGAAAFVLSWQPRLEAAAVPDGVRLEEDLPTLIVPHYDMNGAAECYAPAYRLLGQTRRPDVAVILGVAHSGSTAPFTVTRKPFETPFGALDTDTEIVEGIVRGAPFDSLADEFLHRDEHSVEFQAVLLHFLYRDAEPPSIVPILCGGYHRQGEHLTDPGEPGPTAQFLEMLHKLLAADSRRIALVASADLSHIGMRFGQPSRLTQAQLELARRHDMSLLARAEAGDADGLYRVLAEADDRYNVCGFPAIYALLRLALPTQGHLLSYRQSVERQTQSCVSFAAAALLH